MLRPRRVDKGWDLDALKGTEVHRARGQVTSPRAVLALDD
jgi:hypothetical protein